MPGPTRVRRSARAGADDRCGRSKRRGSWLPRSGFWRRTSITIRLPEAVLATPAGLLYRPRSASRGIEEAGLTLDVNQARVGLRGTLCRFGPRHRTRSHLDDQSTIGLLLSSSTEIDMDLKKEVRRRIDELTRLAYERGYRDGAQSALTEIEKIAGEDLVEQLKESPASLRALAKTAASGIQRRPTVKKRKVQQRKTKANGGAPKAVTVAQCIQQLIASKGEARRDEVLAAARDENPRITAQDVLNGIRTLTRQAAIRVDPKEKSRLLPSEAQTPAG